jgi:RNA polymerase sigma-70 factor (ECF subfamily)
MVATRNGRPFSIGAFTIKNGKIVELDILVDPDRIAQLKLDMLRD